MSGNRVARMEPEPVVLPGRSGRRRLGVRSLMVLVAVVAAGLPWLLPRVAHRFRIAERYVRVKLNEGDMWRHIHGSRPFGEELARALRSGDPEILRPVLTKGFRSRADAAALRALLRGVPMRRTPCELVEATLVFDDDEGRFVSEYRYRCGPAGERPDFVRLAVVTEGGRLKLERVEPPLP